MKFYIRKLNAQELGYRQGIVRQAGRYILISKKLQKEFEFFPRFEDNKIEPSTAVGCINSINDILVYCEYVWQWHKKYPYWKKYQPICDGCVWELKLRNRNGRAKYCSGHESFPRKFKDLIKELNILFGASIKF